jgi:hypothetical protein
MFDLPVELQEAMRDAARDATISAARTFGFGGEAWSVERPTGAGVAAKTLTAQPTVTALAYRQRPGALAQAVAGTPVLADMWRLILLAGALQPGDVITSVADAAYRFNVADVESWYEYTRCELERVR